MNNKDHIKKYLRDEYGKSYSVSENLCDPVYLYNMSNILSQHGEKGLKEVNAIIDHCHSKNYLVGVFKYSIVSIILIFLLVNAFLIIKKKFFDY